MPSAMSCEMTRPGFDGLAEADLVRQDAAALGNPAQRKDHGIDLVRVGIDAAAALAGRVAPLLVRPAQADQVFGEQPASNRSEQARSHHSTRNTFITSSPRWLITFTAMRPDFGLSNGRDVSLCSVAQASSSISALSVVFSAL